MKRIVELPSMAVAFFALGLVGSATADQKRFDDLANLPFEKNRPTVETAQELKDEMLFQRATQTYLWALPLINTLGMKVGAEEAFGSGYNIMPIWTKRLDPKTHVTTPNSDLIYGMAFVNLAETGPLVFESPEKGYPARFLATSYSRG
jgi:hypothetical protein